MAASPSSQGQFVCLPQVTARPESVPPEGVVGWGQGWRPVPSPASTAKPGWVGIQHSCCHGDGDRTPPSPQPQGTLPVPCHRAGGRSSGKVITAALFCRGARWRGRGDGHPLSHRRRGVLQPHCPSVTCRQSQAAALGHSRPGEVQVRWGQGRGHAPPTGPQHLADSSLHARVGVPGWARHAGTGDNGSLGWGHFRGSCNLLLNLQRSQRWPSV